jgi:glucosamine--fructose-6-phosphate aminotransferase (isomerizing)
MTASPFELDIAAQPEALRAFARSPMPRGLDAIRGEHFDRIVLSGMGSSHFAGWPTLRSLVARGRRAWWIDSGQLLETPQVVTPETLLVLTSQSGASGEITALLPPAAAVGRPQRIIGITNDLSSPLAVHSDVVVDLCSGEEATVSTKSYLNSLAAHRRLLPALIGSGADGGRDGGTDGAAHSAAESTAASAAFLERFDPGDVLTGLARKAVDADTPRVAVIGNRDHTATALYAGLIVKEAAKIPAEGYTSGQFRHGPLELAGPGLTAVLFGVHPDDPRPSPRRLAEDLVRSGARVLLVGDLRLDGADTIAVPRGDALGELTAGALVAQRLAVELAKARGIEPGAFTYGSKITTSL